MLRVLVACERSGIVRRAFRERGHDAWSCDVEPADDGSEYHFQCDVLDVLGDGIVRSTHENPYYWDMMVAHPVCTYLTNCGAKHLYIDGRKENGIYQPRWDSMRKGAAFFNRLKRAPIKYKALENPTPHGHARKLIGRYTQEIQPWMFGHPEMKPICLWLEQLPPLFETNNVYEEMMILPKNKRQRIFYESPGADRSRRRSEFFSGVADAMADQWGDFVMSREGGNG